MEFKALSKNVRVSPRKLRVVVDAIKKMSVPNALNQLTFMAKSGAEPVLKALKSAIANAKNIDGLKIKNIFVDEGLKSKRQDKGHRATKDRGIIQKRASHITVILTNG